MTALLFFLRGGKSSSHPSQKGAHLALLFFWSVRRSAPLGPPASLPAHLLRLSEADQGEGRAPGLYGPPDTLYAVPGTRNGAEADTSNVRTRGGAPDRTLWRPKCPGKAPYEWGKAAKCPGTTPDCPIGHQSVRERPLPTGESVFSVRSARFPSGEELRTTHTAAVQLVREPSPLVWRSYRQLQTQTGILCRRQTPSPPAVA